MKIDATWNPPIQLIDGTRSNLIYSFYSDKIPEKSGCYMFYNKYGTSYSILYIGQAENLKRRLKGQQNNVRLMVGIKNSIKGYKHVIYCIIERKKAQKIKTVLNIMEKNLIKIALSNGHTLLNNHGTKKEYDNIVFKGNKHSEKMFGRKMNIERHKN